MKKKVLAIVLVAMMLLGMVACVAPETNNPGSAAAENKFAESGEKKAEKLTVWVEKVFSDDANNCMKAALERFTRDTGIDLEVEFINNTDFMTKLNAAVEAGTTPDVSTADVRKALNYYPNTPYLDVTDLMNEIHAENPLYESIYDISKIDDNFYFIPYTSSADLMYIRKDKMEAAGITEIPTTWEEVFALAEAITDPSEDFAGLGWSLGAGDGDFENSTREVLWNYGGGLFDENGNANASNDINREVLGKYFDMYEKGVIPEGAVSWDGSSNNGNYLLGTVGIVVNACTLNNAMQNDEQYKELYENTIVTSLPGGPENAHHMAYIYGWGIHKDCKNVDAAKELIKYLCNADNYAEYIELLGPTYGPVYEKEGSKEYWSEGVFKSMVDYVKGSDAYVGYPRQDVYTVAIASQVYNAMEFSNAMNSVAAGDLTIDEALAQIDAAIETARATIDEKSAK